MKLFTILTICAVSVLVVCMTVVSCVLAKEPAEREAIRNWQAQKDAIMDQLAKCSPTCPDELKAQYSHVTLEYNKALNVSLGIRPETSHPIICPKHGRVWMTDFEYMGFLESGPLQCLTAALVHELNKRKPDPGRCHFDIHCPICNRVSQMGWR